MRGGTPWFRLLFSLLVVAGLVCLAGCGSDKSTKPDDGIKVRITPAQVMVRVQHTYQFNATVTGAVDPDVTWSLDEGPGWGMVDTTGVYTAPDTMPDPATATVRVTCVEDSTKQATALIDIGSLITVTISPKQITLQLGQTHQFEATATTGKLDPDVTWSIDESEDWGSIDSDGFYAAPAVMPATYAVTIRATSLVDPESCATARLFLSSVDPATMVPDFMLEDMHPDTPTSGTLVSPRDYLGKISVWGFIRGST
ncbi:MAG: hypothetical protein KJ970_11175 [Candidatus Eisenbacteria bacterium]|uniref:BIG2 domain-containing protein n=1 Tax=Eiseniibacteriota bacterium TaxID=2212470 RepID=A0A948WD36_UNCEI|nr:hypothetical protein [Candidatus Eisenbacteria bacterium]MBU1948957.1 hypothetical protein [Candidatus Eisenbacteria bacterium]MBU2691478.1 hypothetical protein [Candidatus Eisenbacteria bacterium]